MAKDRVLWTGYRKKHGRSLHKLPTDLLIQQLVDYRFFSDVSKKNPEAVQASGVVFLKNDLSENRPRSDVDPGYFHALLWL